MSDFHAPAPRAPRITVTYTPERDEYRVAHTVSGARIDIPGAAVRDRLKRAHLPPSWPEQRHAAIALARAFLKRSADADELSRRLAGG